MVAWNGYNHSNTLISNLLCMFVLPTSRPIILKLLNKLKNNCTSILSSLILPTIKTHQTSLKEHLSTKNSVWTIRILCSSSQELSSTLKCDDMILVSTSLKFTIIEKTPKYMENSSPSTISPTMIPASRVTN